jgi:hypothetical protein
MLLPPALYPETREAPARRNVPPYFGAVGEHCNTSPRLGGRGLRPTRRGVVTVVRQAIKP